MDTMDLDLAWGLVLAFGLYRFLRWLSRPDVVAAIWREVERIDRQRDRERD